MRQASSTTQRKNKAPASSTASATREETQELIKDKKNEKSITSNAAPNPKHLVATVRRRKCGTSPFDEHWLNMDCCGLFCAFFTYGLHLYGCYVVIEVLIPPWFVYTGVDAVKKMSLWGRFHIVTFFSIAVLAVYSHFKAMTTDPGTVPPDAEPIPDPSTLVEDPQQLEVGLTTPLTNMKNDMNNNTSLSGVPTGQESPSLSAAKMVAAATVGVGAAAASAAMPIKPPGRMMGKRLCRRCNSFKPKRAHHCSICKRCIIKMDHHCPWVNNCVGIGNHKFFLLFIFYTSLSCLYSLCLVTWRFCECTMGSSVHTRCLENPNQLLHLVGLTCEAILFGLFTCCMMIDQWGVVTTNITNIDRLKGEVFFGFDEHDHDKSGVNEVFGGEQGFRMNWLSPMRAAIFPSSIRDEIMGFCRPCLNNNLCGGRGTERRNSLERKNSLELAERRAMGKPEAEIV